MKILLIEDEESVVKSFRRSVSTFNSEIETCNVVLDSANSVEQAKEKVNGKYDFLLVDLKLNSDPDAGKLIIKGLNTNFVNMPIAVLTGTPDGIEVEKLIIKVYKKGSDLHSDILRDLMNIYLTGITKIMNRKGVLEKRLHDIFIRLLEQKNNWIQCVKITEKSAENQMTRHILDHLLYGFKTDMVDYFPQEFYIINENHCEISTGRIVQSLENLDEYSIILTPACDIERIKEGNKKSNNLITVCQIDSFAIHSKKIINNNEPGQLIGDNQKIRSHFDRAAKNNRGNGIHWLPRIEEYEGGYINFASIKSLSYEDFKKEFKSSNIQVSPGFIKDIVSRFSSYYARQGQPLINPELASKFYGRTQS